jgi:DNA repair protein RadC
VAALLMAEMYGLEQEELRVVLLNTRNQVIDVVTVYRGTLNSSLVRVPEVFKEAIRRNALSIIVAHNHPSGDPEPSPQDRVLTRELVEAGKLLEIEVLDHLVIGRGRWTSLRQSQGWG